MTAPYGPGDPQQPGPGRQYPQYCQYPQHPQQPPGYGPPPAEPSSVRTAFGLWIAALALYLVGQLLAVLLPPTAEDYAA
ncbi:hypothetical protein WCD74_19225 [Actinomycetospora sp. OC33-EN08]|uniref:Uncharacterized protein n=1 Tax=Actinomycetospora aurantiaca TaxID=3129233 RepID=A0ABU8MSH9_9PSEU